MILNKVKNSIKKYLSKKNSCFLNSFKKFLSYALILGFSGTTAYIFWPPNQIAYVTDNIIILNGTSCAGKSTLTKELQKLLGPQWVSFSMDDYIREEFIRLYPDALNYPGLISENKINTYLYKFHSTRMGIILHNNLLFDKMIQDAKKAILQGKRVILDLVLYGEKYNYLLNNLNRYNAKLVMIYSSPVKLLERVRTRNKIARAKGASLKNKDSYRTVARSIRGFVGLYQPTDIKNSLGTMTQEPLTKVLQQASQDFDTTDTIKTGLSNFADFAQTLISKLGLNNKKFVYVTPIQKHDIVIDNSTNSPYDVAQTIASQLQLLSDETSEQKRLATTNP